MSWGKEWFVYLVMRAHPHRHPSLLISPFHALFTRAHTLMYSNMHVTLTCTYMHTCMHWTDTHTLVQKHPNGWCDIHTYTHPQMHMHTYIHTYIHSHTPHLYLYRCEQDECIKKQLIYDVHHSSQLLLHYSRYFTCTGDSNLYGTHFVREKPWESRSRSKYPDFWISIKYR